MVHSYKRESPAVNTVGWATDQGLSFLLDLIWLLSPRLVIQFSSGHSKSMPNLTPDTKSKSKVRNEGFYLAEFVENLKFADEGKESLVVLTGYKLMCVQSNSAFRKTPKNSESHIRVLCDLAVLG